MKALEQSPSVLGKAYRKFGRDSRRIKSSLFRKAYPFLHRHWHSVTNPQRPPLHSAESALTLGLPPDSCQVLHPSTKVRRVTPEYVTEQALKSEFTEVEYVEVDQYVASLEEARVFAPSTVITRNHKLLKLESFEFNVCQECDRHIYHQLRLPKLDRIPGTVALIASDDIQNYHHWLFYTLPRLGLVLESKWASSDVRFLVNRLTRPFHYETLKTLDITEDRLLISEDHLYLACETLLVTPAPFPARHPKSGVAFVRRTLGSTCENPQRRIYLARGNAATRRCVNEEQVLEAIAPWNFETISMDGRTVAEQAKIMAEAKIVVAPHGAAMSNIVFMTPGTIVLELMHAHLNICFFWDLASQVGLRYSAIESEMVASSNPKVLPHMVDFKVDIEQLKQRIADLLESNQGEAIG